MATAKKPAAKKISAIEKLLNDTQQAFTDQKALNKRLVAINKRYVKVDPSKDQKAADELEKVSTELHYINGEADLFSAAAAGDPWLFVEDVMSEIVDLGGDDGSGQWEELHDKICANQIEIDQDDLEAWRQLGMFRNASIMSCRQEQWIARYQNRYYEILEGLNIEMPYPSANENAYW